jgi:hypothetical protein
VRKVRVHCFAVGVDEHTLGYTDSSNGQEYGFTAPHSVYAEFKKVNANSSYGMPGGPPSSARASSIAGGDADAAAGGGPWHGSLYQHA